MPFTRTDLDCYLAERQLDPRAVEYIRGAAVKLSRDVQNRNFSNVRTEYQSSKMGTTYHTESRTGELPLGIHLDFDQDVPGFYEQPPEVDCFRSRKSGSTYLTTYAPDTVILHKDAPFVAQVKPKSALDRLVATSPDWVFQDGQYQDLPAARALEAHGLPHVVIPSESFGHLRTSNIALLLQSLDEPDPDNAFERSCLEFVQDQGLITLAALAKSRGLTDLSPLLNLMARHRLFTDLGRFSLTRPEACLVASDVSMLHEQVHQAWEQLGRDHQAALSGRTSRLRLPSAKQLKRGLAIVRRLNAGLGGGSAPRWNALIAKGKESGISEIAAVSPKTHLSGNRNAKRPEIVLAFAEHMIRRHWADDPRPTPAALYRLYSATAIDWHPAYKPVTKPTFRNLLREMKDGLARDRGGKRAAHAAESPTNVEDRALPAGRPFELASCDHYLVDLYVLVLDANGTTYAMQPWLTVLRDCYSKKVLSFWLTLRPPSRRSCALVVRQCVRLHGRLPETIIVDHGAEFDSDYFSGLMAHLRVNLMFRPAGHPRYGSEAERFFGQFKSLWLSMRPGNKVSLREVRSVSGSHRPERLACLGLFDLWEDLLAFNEWLDHYATDSMLASPAVLMHRGIAQFGCSGKKVTYDDDFVIGTAVDFGEFSLDPQRGLHIGAFHYWNPKLGASGKRRFQVRIDPEDPYRVYSLIGDEWITCLASKAPTFLTQTGLAQAVEGVLVLDGSKAREAAKQDADYRLVNAVKTRQTEMARNESAPYPDPTPVQVTADPADELFAAAAASELTGLETNRW